MTQQAQIDALEHLLLTIIRKNPTSLVLTNLFEEAQASVMGENNASGSAFKSEAHNYLDHLKITWKL